MNPRLFFVAALGLVASACVAVRDPALGALCAFGVAATCRPSAQSYRLGAVDTSHFDTVSDLVKLNIGADSPVGEIIMENVVHAPELMVMPAEIIDGDSFPATVRTGLPTVEFREYNEGVNTGKATYKNITVQCKLIDARVEADKRLADGYRKGPAAWQVIKASEIMEAIMRTCGRQVYYGAANSAKGFPGFVDLVDSTMEVDATGTTANGKTSVWAVKLSPVDASLVFGGGKLFDLNPQWRVETITPDPDQPTKRIDGYVNQWGGLPGMQVLNKNCIARIKNLTDQSGKGLTLTMLYDLLEKFPTGVKPDVIFMTRHSRGQERKSRITDLVTNPEPLKDVDGVPIEVTDSISLTEA